MASSSFRQVSSRTSASSTPAPPPSTPSSFLRLPSHDILRVFMHHYCEPVPRAHLSLTCKGLRAALVASTTVLGVRWPAVVLPLEPKVQRQQKLQSKKGGMLRTMAEKKQHHRGASGEGKEGRGGGHGEDAMSDFDEEDEDEDEDEDNDDDDIEEQEDDGMWPHREEEEGELALGWMELQPNTRPPAQLLCHDDWRHLQRLDVWNAGLLLPAVIKTLLARPFPHLTHLLLSTDNMPLCDSIALARDGARVQIAARKAALEARDKVKLFYEAKIKLLAVALEEDEEDMLDAREILEAAEAAFDEARKEGEGMEEKLDELQVAELAFEKAKDFRNARLARKLGYIKKCLRENRSSGKELEEGQRDEMKAFLTVFLNGKEEEGEGEEREEDEDGEEDEEDGESLYVPVAKADEATLARWQARREKEKLLLEETKMKEIEEAGRKAATGFLPEDTTSKTRAACLELLLPEAWEAGREEERHREWFLVSDEEGRLLGEAWRKAYLLQLESLSLDGVKFEGGMMGAFLRGAGWVEEEGVEGEREGRMLTRSARKAKDQEENMMKIDRKEREDKGQEGGSEKRKQGEELAGLLLSLDLGKTDFGKKGPQALAQAFNRWGSPTSSLPSLPPTSLSVSSSSALRREEEWAKPSESLCMNGWAESNVGRECGQAGGRRVEGSGSEVGSEDGQDDDDIGQRERERGEILRSMLFSSACRALEVLRLGETVNVTEHEAAALTNLLAAGRGHKLKELEVAHETHWVKDGEGGGGGEHEGEEGEDGFDGPNLHPLIHVSGRVSPLIVALISPQTCPPFLQVLSLGGCCLQGAPIECLARGFSPSLPSSSSSSSGCGLFPSLRELYLCECDLTALDVRVLLKGLQSENGRKGGSGETFKVLALSHNDLALEGFVAVWEELSEGACPSLIELRMNDVGMNNDAIRYGLARAIRRRRTERGGEGGVCPCLASLEVLHLSKSYLGYLGPLWLSRALPCLHSTGGGGNGGWVAMPTGTLPKSG